MQERCSYGIVRDGQVRHGQVRHGQVRGARPSQIRHSAAIVQRVHRWATKSPCPESQSSASLAHLRAMNTLPTAASSLG